MNTAERFDVTGKVVVVTGGTKGLGHAFALGLAQAGAKIVVSSRKQELCEQVAADLQRKGYVGRGIGIKLRYADFSTVTRDHTLAVPTQDAAAIRHAAGLCLKRAPLTQRLRLLGVRVGGLSRLDEGPRQTPPRSSDLPAPTSQPGLF